MSSEHKLGAALDEVLQASKAHVDALAKLKPRRFPWHRIVLPFGRWLYRHYPNGTLTNRIYWLGLFVSVHRRFPRRDRFLSDVLFRQAVSGELDKSLRRMVTDKYESKAYVNEKLGEERAVPTFAVLSSMEEVEAYEFPNRCVVKPTVNWKRVFLRLDGEQIPYHEFAQWLRHDFFLDTRETNYKDHPLRLVVEEFALGQQDPKEIKILYFDGKLMYFRVFDFVPDYPERHSREYDRHWQPLDLTVDARLLQVDLEKPVLLDEMAEAGAKIAEDFSGIVRVDFYYDDHDWKIGEITNLPTGVVTRIPNLAVEREFAKRVFPE
ncbi:MAG: ATP-grasp fold amidoligase family protein [Pseudomonadota bacterium]